MYAHRAGSRKHEEAKLVLTGLVRDGEVWGIPVFCIGEYLRVVTHPAIFDPPSTVTEACNALSVLLDSTPCRVLLPGDDFVGLFLEAIREADAGGNRAFDAQIAALCMEAGVRELITDDRDFLRFKKLRIRQI